MRRASAASGRVARRRVSRRRCRGTAAGTAAPAARSTSSALPRRLRTPGTPLATLAPRPHPDHGGSEAIPWSIRQIRREIDTMGLAAPHDTHHVDLVRDGSVDGFLAVGGVFVQLVLVRHALPER